MWAPNGIFGITDGCSWDIHEYILTILKCSIKNWRNNDWLSCAQKSAGMCVVGGASTNYGFLAYSRRSRAWVVKWLVDEDIYE